jgi:hypothetical protein
LLNEGYSFGIVLWEIFHRAEPYMGIDTMVIAIEVPSKARRPEISDACPGEIKGMLQRKKKRKTQRKQRKKRKFALRNFSSHAWESTRWWSLLKFRAKPADGYVRKNTKNTKYIFYLSSLFLASQNNFFHFLYRANASVLAPRFWKASFIPRNRELPSFYHIPLFSLSRFRLSN